MVYSGFGKDGNFLIEPILAAYHIADIEAVAHYFVFVAKQVANVTIEKWYNPFSEEVDPYCKCYRNMKLIFIEIETCVDAPAKNTGGTITYNHTHTAKYRHFT